MENLENDDDEEEDEESTASPSSRSQVATSDNGRTTTCSSSTIIPALKDSEEEDDNGQGYEKKQPSGKGVCTEVEDNSEEAATTGKRPASENTNQGHRKKRAKKIPDQHSNTLAEGSSSIEEENRDIYASSKSENVDKSNGESNLSLRGEESDKEHGQPLVATTSTTRAHAPEEPEGELLRCFVAPRCFDY
jgi:hypothetical protein